MRTDTSAHVVDLLPSRSSQNWLDEALENPIPLQSPFGIGYFTWSLQAVPIWLRASRLSMYGMLFRPLRQRS